MEKSVLLFRGKETDIPARSPNPRPEAVDASLEHFCCLHMQLHYASTFDLTTSVFDHLWFYVYAP